LADKPFLGWAVVKNGNRSPNVVRLHGNASGIVAKPESPIDHRSASSALGVALASMVEDFFRELRAADAAIGGTTIARKGQTRVLCYVGPLPVGVDGVLRDRLGAGFQVSAIRNSKQCTQYKTIVGNGLFVWERSHVRSAERETLPPPSGATASAAGQTRGTAIDDARRVLGISKDADVVVIQAAYRALAAKYHPDRVAGKGLQAGTEAQANFIRVQAAYALLMDDETSTKKA
jgi:DnaJ domain